MQIGHQSTMSGMTVVRSSCPVQAGVLTLRTLKHYLTFVDAPSRAALVAACNWEAKDYMPEQVLEEIRESSSEACSYWKRLTQANAAVCAADDAADPALVGVRHFVAKNFGGWDLPALGCVVDWLVAEHGLKVEQAEGIALPDLLAKLRTVLPDGENFDKLTRDQRKIIAYLNARDDKRASLRDLMKHMGKQHASATERKSCITSIRRLNERLADDYPHIEVEYDCKAETVTAITHL
jgi:hypothetical protein